MELIIKYIAPIVYLVILESLLSFDNALALAALVKRQLSDPEQQKKALRWGIWGAYIFRTIAIFLGVWIMESDIVKLLAGFYLVWLMVKHLLIPELESQGDNNGRVLTSLFGIRISPLWSTIIAVEIMDVAFSVDSIGVALAVSNVYWVLICGAFLGILTMRFAAGVFIKMIARFPLLEKTAFLLVGLAGLNVCLKVFHVHIPEAIFLGVMGAIFLGTLIISKPLKEGTENA